MRKIMAGLVVLFVSMQAASVHGQSSKYPPLSEYMMTPEAEMALARSAAPEDNFGSCHCQDTYSLRIQSRHPRRQRFRVPRHAGLGSTNIYSCSAPGPRVLLKAPRANLLQSRREPNRFAVARTTSQARNGRQDAGPDR